MAGKKSKKGKKKSGKNRPKLWTTLEHNGIVFPPPYEPKGMSIKIRGQKVALTPFQEEMAYQWAKKKDTPYAQDPVFQKNFTADFARALGKGYSRLAYKEIDFGSMYRIVDREKDAREALTKEQRKKLAAERKEIRLKMKEKYGTAMIDGKPVEMGNYMAEPPGIFIGRGAHPLRGKWKRRITHADVTLNLGKDAKVPPGKWGKIEHNNKAMWMAGWMDELTHSHKYIWLADTAGLKQDKDRAKYDKAVTLKSKIGKVREQMVADLGSKDKGRIATVCYLIFRTSMRVGDEKDPDEADTVGATTLRKEHVTLGKDSVKFDFLGKDSIRWEETLKLEPAETQFRDNLESMMRSKKPSDEIFDGITSKTVNDYFKGIVPGMTAKVFRTYLATKVVEEYLKKHMNLKGKPDFEKIHHAKLANLEAAKMCNHKRTIPKTFEKSLEKRRERLKAARLKKPKDPKKETPKQKQRRKERVRRLELQLELAEKTRDYNIGTSLRNYIDPRIIKDWTDKMDARWDKLYTAALQKKFLWVRGPEDAK